MVTPFVCVRCDGIATATRPSARRGRLAGGRSTVNSLGADAQKCTRQDPDGKLATGRRCFGSRSTKAAQQAVAVGRARRSLRPLSRPPLNASLLDRQDEATETVVLCRAGSAGEWGRDRGDDGTGSLPPWYVADSHEVVPPRA